ncbi:MAG: phosphatase [Defluviitaleaceae bacterium]|nr:phosphatase [Defluviitaleaceae bacterium]
MKQVQKNEEWITARREYQREWRRKNKLRVAEYNREYWLKRAEKKKEAQHDTDTSTPK